MVPAGQPAAFPALTVVAPFGAGAAAALLGVMVWSGRRAPDNVPGFMVFGLAVAWGQAAGFLIAVKVWARIAAWRRTKLVGRPPWVSFAGGAAAAAVWYAVLVARSRAWYRGTEASDTLTYVSGLGVEGMYILACADGLTRRAAAEVVPADGTDRSSLTQSFHRPFHRLAGRRRRPAHDTGRRRDG